MLSNRDTNYKGWGAYTQELTYCSKTHTSCKYTAIMRSAKAIYSLKHLTRTSQCGLRLFEVKINLYWRVRLSPLQNHEWTVCSWINCLSDLPVMRSKKKKMLWGNIRGRSEHWHSSCACQSRAGLTEKISHSPSEKIRLQSLVNRLFGGLCAMSLQRILMPINGQQEQSRWWVLKLWSAGGNVWQHVLMWSLSQISEIIL